jgi:hypothetical protein
MQKKVKSSGHVWMTAQAFYDAAELVMVHGAENLGKYSMPLVVNFAFCAELCLKAAEVTVHQTPVTPEGLVSAAAMKSALGHNLLKLFAGLPPDTQQKITDGFLGATGEPLAPLLIRCAGYFEQARYQFEKKGGAYDLGAVKTLAGGLLASVRGL